LISLGASFLLDEYTAVFAVNVTSFVKYIRQELHLPKLGEAPEFSTPFHGSRGDRIGRIFVDRDGPRIDRMRPLQRFPEESSGGCCIPLG
jgi:hypothetical protein